MTEPEDCDAVPSCTYYADAVEPGDMLRIGHGVPIDLIETLDQEELAAYYMQRTGRNLDDLPTLDPNTKATAIVRLATMDIMEEIVPYFDDLHRLRDRGIPIIYAPFWANQTLFNHCSAEDRECAAVEEKLQELEQHHIQSLKSQGYALWLGQPLEYGPDGSYTSIAHVFRPHPALFDGVYVWLGAGGDSLPQPMKAEAMANAVRGLAADIGDLPVILVGGGQLEINTKGIFCEADICASDFQNAYRHTEAWMTAALEAFEPGQLAGFGLGGYDSAHFDIREPYEQFEFFPLNRSGETGYNSPALNVYRAR